MQKKKYQFEIATGVVAVLYLLLMFVIPFLHGPVFWLSLVFTILSFGIFVYGTYKGLILQPDVQSKFYGFPMVKIVGIYLIAQIIACFIFSGLGQWIPMWIPTIVYALMLGAAVIGLQAADVVVDEIKTLDKKLKKDAYLMKSLQSKVNQMKLLSDDDEIVKEISDFSEELKYSDPVSSESLAEIENELSDLINQLQQAVMNNEKSNVKLLSKKAKLTLSERNRLCKLNK